MSVINAYVNSRIAAKTKVKPVNAGFGRPQVLVQTFEVAAGDDDGSVYRLARLPSNLIPFRITIACDAITNGTDWDLGLYKTLDKGGAVASKDKFMDGQTFAAASKVLNGFAAVPIENYGKTLAEHLGLTDVTADSEYDLALTANTVGTVDGTVTVIAEFAFGG